MENVVIAGYARSPFTPANKGDLTKVRPDELAAQVIKGLIERTGVNVDDIEDLIVGCAFPEGEQGLNVARLIGFLSDLPLSVAGTTVNRFCGSSMQAIHMAAGAIQMDAGDRQGQLRQEPDQARHVQSLLALGEGAADDQVLDVS